MPSRIDSNLKTVIDQFTPDILGVFWITNAELSRDLLGFDEFNYLFDGLISQYLYGQIEKAGVTNLHTSNVFFTKNFSRNLFLVHLEMQKEIVKVFNEQMTLILENKSSERKKILIFDQTNRVSNISGSDLQKRYPQFQFINLELS
jgi:hypothetical protein